MIHILRTSLIAFFLLTLLVKDGTAQMPGTPGGPAGPLKGWAVVTGFSQFVGSPNYVGSDQIKNDFVVALINLHTPQGPSTNWQPPTYLHPTWMASRMGQVFGIAIDKRNNIYVTATSSYISNTYLQQLLPYPTQVAQFFSQAIAFGSAGSGGIYRIDGTTGVVTDFITTINYTTATTPTSRINTSALPNGNGQGIRPGLGNITYDYVHDRLFVTNMEDGAIYRINPLTQLIDAAYDPGATTTIPSPTGTSNPSMIGDNQTVGFAPLGERLWGIGYNARENRLYYSVWMEDVEIGNSTGATANVIRSVALNPVGNFVTSDDRMEIILPEYPVGDLENSVDSFSCPISDIEFSTAGDMLVGESSMNGDMNRTRHYSRVFKFTGSSPTWSLPQQIFVGLPTPNPVSSTALTQGNTTTAYYPRATFGNVRANSSGGVDFGYQSSDSITHAPLNCDASLVMNGGDLLNDPSLGIIYKGLQQTPSSGNTALNVQTTGYFIDFNYVQNASGQFMIGDVDVFRDSCGSVGMTPNCDSTSISYTPVSGGGSCCYKIQLTNNQLNTWLNVTAHSLTSGFTFSAQAPNNWAVNSMSTSATFFPPGQYIPTGNTDSIIICGNTTVNAPQRLEITWHAANGTVCRDTVTFDCTPPPPPEVIVNDSNTSCTSSSPGAYTYQHTFTVTNNTGKSTPSHYLMVDPVQSGVTASPDMFMYPPLSNGQTSGPLTLTLSGPSVVPGATICFYVQMHGDTSSVIQSDGYTWCSDIDTFCITLPKCADCCEGFQKTIQIPAPPVTQPILGVSQIASQLSAGPAAITKFTATIVSAHRKVNGNPTHCATTGWLPVSGEIINPQSSVGGLPLSNTPPPFSSTPPAPYSEAIWGTNPSGIAMSNTPFTLQMKFPDPPVLEWWAGPHSGYCTDSLRFCVRFTYTDVNCRTCDTLICYQVYRTGPRNIIYTETNPNIGIGHGTLITMTSKTVGTLTIDLPPIPPDVSAENGFRLTEVSMEAGAGVRLTQFDGKTAPNFVGTKSLALGNGQKVDIPLTYDNYSDQSSFINFIKYRYVELRNTKDTLNSEGQVVARTPNSILPGGDVFGKDDSTAKPTNVRTYALYFAVSNKSKVPVATVNISVDKDTKILATGPYEDSDSLQYEAVNGVYDGKPYLFPVTSKWATASIECRPPQGATIRPVYLTVAGSTGKTLVIHYVTRDDAGNILTEDSVTLSDPLSSVKKNDPPSGARSSGYLYPPYPNPTASSTTLQFRLDAGEYATLSVLDALGNEVLNVLSNQFITGGEHVFNIATDNLPSGSYTVRLHTDSGTQTQRLTIIR